MAEQQNRSTARMPPLLPLMPSQPAAAGSRASRVSCRASTLVRTQVCAWRCRRSGVVVESPLTHSNCACCVLCICRASDSRQHGSKVRLHTLRMYRNRQSVRHLKSVFRCACQVYGAPSPFMHQIVCRRDRERPHGRRPPLVRRLLPNVCFEVELGMGTLGSRGGGREGAFSVGVSQTAPNSAKFGELSDRHGLSSYPRVLSSCKAVRWLVH